MLYHCHVTDPTHQIQIPLHQESEQGEQQQKKKHVTEGMNEASQSVHYITSPLGRHRAVITIATLFGTRNLNKESRGEAAVSVKGTRIMSSKKEKRVGE